MITHRTFDKAFAENVRRQRGTTIIFEGRESIADQLSGSHLEFSDGDIYLDFSNVEIVNSADLSALIRFRLRMIKVGKAVRVCNVGPSLLEVFELTRFPPRESFTDERDNVRRLASEHAFPLKK